MQKEAYATISAHVHVVQSLKHPHSPFPQSLIVYNGVERQEDRQNKKLQDKCFTTFAQVVR